MTIFSRLASYSQVLSRIPPNISKCQSTRNIKISNHSKAKGFGSRIREANKDKGIGKEEQVKEIKEVKRPPEYEANWSNTQNTPNTPLSKYVFYTMWSLPTVFTGCVIWQYENLIELRKRMQRGINNKISMDDLKAMGIRQQLNHIWNTIGSGRQLGFTLISINLAIFVLWRVPSVQPMLMRYFSCLPAKGHSVMATTLSAFSHQSPTHLFFNMYVLYTFMIPLTLYLGGKEQALALFLGGATFGGLASSVFKVFSGRMVPSVGASAGLLAFISYMCISHPENRFSIILVDIIYPHSFSSTTALSGLVVLDCLGIVRGWRLFDHAGHLGGALFGALYAAYGPSMWLWYRKLILPSWHEFRGGKPPKGGSPPPSKS